MQQERVYPLVGLFVIGALTLSMFTILFFYDQYLHDKVETYVMFFKGSIEGLGVTSTVSYRGVKVGEVKLIEITQNPLNHKIEIPVFVQFYVDKEFGKQQNPIQALIEQGYVAQIQSPNIFTGIASINISRSGLPINPIWQKYHGYAVFPTAINTKDYMTMNDTLMTAKQTFKDVSEFMHSERLRSTLDSAKTMVDSFDKLANRLDQQVPPLFTNLDESLKQISNAANSTQNLADYLARYPESLLRGKK